MRQLLMLSICIWLAACKNSPEPINKFSDPLIVQLYDFQDRRNTDSLLRYLQHDDARYRMEAALAFASLQDSSAIDALHKLLLNDTDVEVRKHAAFALGQTVNKKSAEALVQAYPLEKKADVLNAILEAYGKTTSRWLVEIDPADTTLSAGFAWGLNRYAARGLADSSLHVIAAQFLKSNYNNNTRLAAAHYFARSAQKFDFVANTLITAATTDSNVDVRMAAAFALRKITSDDVLMAIDKILQTEPDYRVRIGALRALQQFPIEQVKTTLLTSLKDSSTHVGIATAEIIQSIDTQLFWEELLKLARETANWRIQALLYDAVLKSTEQSDVVDEIQTRYNQSTNPYQRAALLTALQRSVTSYKFIYNELLKADTPVVRSATVSALVSINKHKNFTPALQKTFVSLYSDALQIPDLAIIGTIAGTLSDSTLGYKKIITDYSFLHRAKEKLSLPKDNEALQPLEKAIAYFENKPYKPVVNNFNHPIDWELVKRTPSNQQATLKTTQGDINIRLLVEEAPGSVANFISLVNASYYDGKNFHRVVPNFVAQAGCNRGDGWGGEDYSIRSEFSMRTYTTGSVGMASAGKDTEGTQWFITHSPTPHLDGRYTIFAEVTAGMDIVHQLGVGDKILQVTLHKQ